MYKELLKQSKGLRLLYVEDDEGLKEATLSFLGAFFNQIDPAENGAVGLALYQKNFYDIVVSDISMPVMDGIELCRQIKSLNEKQQIIITSAHDDPAYLDELRGVGVEFFINKPMEMEVIVKVLGDVCTMVNRERDLFIQEMREHRLAALKEVAASADSANGMPWQEGAEESPTLSVSIEEAVDQWMHSQGEVVATLKTVQDGSVSLYGRSVGDMLFMLLSSLHGLMREADALDLSPLALLLEYRDGKSILSIGRSDGRFEEQFVQKVQRALYAGDSDFQRVEAGLFLMRRFVVLFLQETVSLETDREGLLMRLEFPATAR